MIEREKLKNGVLIKKKKWQKKCSSICRCCWLVTQLYPTLCNPMDCSLAGSSGHGVSQATLERVVLSFSSGSSWPRSQACVSCIAGRFFITVTSLVAQMVNNWPAMQETQVQSLGWEDPVEKDMVTHSSILAWRIPSTEENGGIQSIG